MWKRKCKCSRLLLVFLFLSGSFLAALNESNVRGWGGQRSAAVHACERKTMRWLCRSWPDSAARREAGSVNDVRALGASFSGTSLVRSSFYGRETPRYILAQPLHSQNMTTAQHNVTIATLEPHLLGIFPGSTPRVGCMQTVPLNSATLSGCSTGLDPDVGLVRLQVRVVLLPLLEIGPQIEGSSLDSNYTHVPAGHAGFSYLRHT